MTYEFYSKWPELGGFVKEDTDYVSGTKSLFTVEADSKEEAYKKAIEINNERYMDWVARSIANSWKENEYSKAIKAHIGTNAKEETINKIIDHIKVCMKELKENELPEETEHDGTFTIYIEE
jgi:16S rRNA C967 or C1407 C5-methylase (RsmB/RsmF family)